MTHNPGVAFDSDWIRQTRLDETSMATWAQRYADAVAEPAESEDAMLIGAIRCLDLTSLRHDDTSARIRALCAEGLAPLDGVPGREPTPDVRVAAVCVFPSRVATAVAALGEAPIPVAAACGFPDGAPERRSEEIRRAAASGASEVDVVIDRSLVLESDWAALYDQVRTIRAASSGLLLKVILRSGTLSTSSEVARAGLTSAMAGADFLKTSTGMDPVNATLSAGIALAEAIRAYHRRSGVRVGLKPAGGLRTVSDAFGWMRLARGELGAEWMNPSGFRLGASSLLGALRARLAVPGGR